MRDRCDPRQHVGLVEYRATLDDCEKANGPMVSSLNIAIHARCPAPNGGSHAVPARCARIRLAIIRAPIIKSSAWGS